MNVTAPQANAVAVQPDACSLNVALGAFCGGRYAYIDGAAGLGLILELLGNF